MPKLTLALILIASIFITSCSTVEDLKEDEAILWPVVLLESSSNTFPTVPVTLPVSQKTIMAYITPAFTPMHILNVEKIKVDLGFCILIQLTPRAARRLYTLTADNRGKRFLLGVNDQPLGQRLIDGVIPNGNLFFFLEYPDEDLDELVIELKKSLKIIHKKAGSRISKI
tara:strand:+ start:644 stop:1153 length:510 start_codon:yes stop_codon:yes gene_type:complete